MPAYAGMPGVAGTLHGSAFATTPDDLVAKVAAERVSSAAGDGGCVMGWRDDAGLLRGAVMRYRDVLEAQQFLTLEAMREWAEGCWQIIADPDFSPLPQATASPISRATAPAELGNSGTPTNTSTHTGDQPL